MAKAKRDYKELILGLVIVAVIGAVFLAQTTEQTEIITGNTVYPVYASIAAETPKAVLQGTLDVGGYGVCESYSWGAQTKMTNGKSIGAKFNVCSATRYGFNYECAMSSRDYVYPKETGVICSPAEVCDIVAGKATCVNA